MERITGTENNIYIHLLIRKNPPKFYQIQIIPIKIRKILLILLKMDPLSYSNVNIPELKIKMFNNS